MYPSPSGERTICIRLTRYMPKPSPIMSVKTPRTGRRTSAHEYVSTNAGALRAGDAIRDRGARMCPSGND